MTACSFCNKETLVIFTCPYCKENFCLEHYRPENHNCSGRVQSNDQLIKNNDLPIIYETNELDSSNNTSEEELIEEETIDVVKAQAQAVLTSIIGINKKKEDFDEEELKKYKKIYDYFLEAWKKNFKLKQENDALLAELDSIKAKFELLTSEHEKLL